MKVIETVYNNYRFRSRLEARYAVFFDVLGIEYKYEYEGFDLDGTWYLPDFWLPKLKRWIEIKGDKPTDTELSKIEKLHQYKGHPACLFYGLPGDNLGFAYYECAHQSGNGGLSFNEEVEWRQCPCCATIDVNIRHGIDHCRLYSYTIDEHINSCSCDYERLFKNLCSRSLSLFYKNEEFRAMQHDTARKMYKSLDQKEAMTFDLRNAYTTARQARFEHGTIYRKILPERTW